MTGSAGSTNMLRSRMRCGSLTDIILLAVFLVLVYIFLQRRTAVSVTDTNSNSQTGRFSSKTSSASGERWKILVDERIKKLPDVRSRTCQQKRYGSKHRATIIIDFFDYQFYDLKITLGSVLQYTDLDDIQEIIVVDDGSTLDYIIADAQSFVKNIPKARLLRMDTRDGSYRGRMRAAHDTTSVFLVFMDTNVVCTPGWLPPLLHHLTQDRNSIAVPHYDNINDPVSYEYKETSLSLVTGFSWTLTMRMTQLQHPKTVDSKPLDTAVMRGNVFALTTSFFRKIGGYDDNLRDKGALSLELSFRAWLCDDEGNIKILPCSRVGIISLNTPLKVVDSESIRRISEVWLNDRKHFVYKYTHAQVTMSSAEQSTNQQRRTQLESLRCKKFEWYVSNVVKELYTPSKDARFFGIIKCKSGSCARIAKDQRMELIDCKDGFTAHKPEMIFELDTDGYIRNQGKCLSVESSAYIMLVDCKKDNPHHLWEYQYGGKLINKWSRYCSMHVTDPDKKVPHGRQIVMAQECSDADNDMFVSFDFVTP